MLGARRIKATNSVGFAWGICLSGFEIWGLGPGPTLGLRVPISLRFRLYGSRFREFRKSL